MMGCALTMITLHILIKSSLLIVENYSNPKCVEFRLDDTTENEIKLSLSGRRPKIHLRENFKGFIDFNSFEGM